jgi:hypothetical protein
MTSRVTECDGDCENIRCVGQQKVSKGKEGSWRMRGQFLSNLVGAQGFEPWTR